MSDNDPRMEIKPSRHDLHSSGDSYLRELVAFHDMTATITTDNANAVEDWVAANKVHISEEDLAELPDLIGKMVDAITRAAAYMKGVEHGSLSGDFEPIEIKSSRPGPQAVVQDLFLKMAVKVVIDRVELVGRAFLISAISSFEVLFGNLIRAIYDRNPTALSA